MDFYLERKYIVAIGLLVAGLVAGGLVLARQNGGIGLAGANLSRMFGSGQWTEIKLRTANSTITTVAGLTEKNKITKAVLPVIQWCEAVKGTKGQGDMLPKAGNSHLREASASQVGNGTVVINEIAWMGTAQSYSDEWIELKNISDAAMDLSGWQLQNKNQKIKIAFGAGEILSAGELYLLERTDDETVPEIIADKIYKGNLGNSNEALYLFDANCRLRDSVIVAAKWPAGDNATKKTMIRLPSLRWQNSAAGGGTPGMEN